MGSLDIWKFLAGLGLFLYGISLMEQVMGRMAGRSFKLFLQQQTQSLPKAVFGGAFITGLIQSSSVIILMLMSFVGARIISFRNALGVLIGSNLGTTADSWFVATVGFKFNLQAYSMPVIAIAAISMFFTQKRKQLYDSLYFVFSIGILLLGFGFMKEGAEQLVVKFDIAAYADYNSVIILLAGFCITVLIQSSLATVAIALTALHAHALSFPAAACLILGAEVGTTIKILLSSINGSSEKKMLAWSDFGFNVFTAVVSLVFLPWIIILITDIFGIRDPLIGLVFFQSFINLVSILVFMPFINPFARWIASVFYKKKGDHEASFINEQPVIPQLAPFIMKKAAHEIFMEVIGFQRKIFDLDTSNAPDGILPKIRSFARLHGTTNITYSNIKEREGDLLRYYIKLQQQDTGKKEYEEVSRLLSAIRQTVHAAKSIHDIRHNLQAFNSSANNYLFSQYNLLQQEWREFDQSARGILAEEAPARARLMIEGSRSTAFKHFQFNVSAVGKPLGSHEISEMEASTLLNVYEELWSSKKQVLKALELLKHLPGEQMEMS